MSSQPHAHRDDEPLAPADDLASRLLDDESSAVEGELSAADRHRIADLQWLDALLEHAQGHQDAAAKGAVAATVARLQAEPTRVAVRLEKARGFAAGKPALSLLAAAAVILLMGVLWWSQPKSAYAMVEQAYRAALSPIDRTYQVSFSADNLPSTVRTATLTVRGGEAFVFEHTGPLGGRTWIGSSGRDFWFIPPVGPALVADSEQFVGQWMQRSQTDMPFLQLTTILARIRDHYDLATLPAESLAGRGPTFDHLRASRRSTTVVERPLLPESIELWSDRQTGIVQRLILTRPREITSNRHTTTFDLARSEPREASFYEVTTHADNRRVIRATTAQ